MEKITEDDDAKDNDIRNKIINGIKWAKKEARNYILLIGVMFILLSTGITALLSLGICRILSLAFPIIADNAIVGVPVCVGLSLIPIVSIFTKVWLWFRQDVYSRYNKVTGELIDFLRENSGDDEACRG